MLKGNNGLVYHSNDIDLIGRFSYLFLWQSNSMTTIGAPVRHSMKSVVPTATTAPLATSLVHVASCLLCGAVVTSKFPSMIN